MQFNVFVVTLHRSWKAKQKAHNEISHKFISGFCLFLCAHTHTPRSRWSLARFPHMNVTSSLLMFAKKYMCRKSLTMFVIVMSKTDSLRQFETEKAATTSRNYLRGLWIVRRRVKPLQDHFIQSNVASHCAQFVVAVIAAGFTVDYPSYHQLFWYNNCFMLG